MKQKTNRPSGPAAGLSEVALKIKFPLELRTRTPDGAGVVVRYRRIKVKDGFDVEAVILSDPPAGEPEGA